MSNKAFDDFVRKQNKLAGNTGKETEVDWE